MEHSRAGARRDHLPAPLQRERRGGGGHAGRSARPVGGGPGPTFYESLAVGCIVAQPSRLAGSFTAVATRGARVIGFRRLREGVRALGETFAARGRDLRYALLYWDLIDQA